MGMKELQLKKYRLAMAKHCFVVKEGKLVDLMSKVYGRRVALKIFDLEVINKIDDFYRVKWGDDPQPQEPRLNTFIWEATQIQNILNWHGLAPRVYGLETVSIADRLSPMQVIEWSDGDFGDNDSAYDVYKKVIDIGKNFGFECDKHDVSGADVMGNQLIDLQTFTFSGAYKETVKKIYIEDGRYGKVYYQDVPELELSGGPRRSVARVDYMALDKIDFKNKTVWDMGCAGGFFCRYAIDRGAKRVIGFDMAKTVNAARHVSNYLGYFNIDYHVTNFPTLPEGVPELDIMFCLSMNFHIGLPGWLGKPKTLIFEDNGKVSRNNSMPDKEVLDLFDKCEPVGKGIDHGNKPIYHLTKS